MTVFDIWLAEFAFICNDNHGTSRVLGVSYIKILNQLWPHTCNCKNDSDWLQRWVEAQHNI